MRTLWRINRLRTMGPRELLYRMQRAGQLCLEQVLPLPNAPLPRGRPGKAWLETLPRDLDSAPFIAAGDRVLKGRYDVFALRGAELGFPPDWNRDPKSGTTVQLAFGKTLDYRDEARVGDIKYLWEINRHLELVTLAQAYHLSGESRFAEGVQHALESWFDQCPYPLGPNWTSALEHAIRLANWSIAWHLVGSEDSVLFAGRVGAAFRSRWLTGIYRHCRFIAGHLSRFSSANNHLLGEYMGLFIGATTWPMWPESSRWLTLACRGLENETQRQIGSDGVGREQAFWYLHAVADMMLLCGLYGRSNGTEFSTRYWKRLEAMLEFISAIMDYSGRVPMVGDSDDAVIVRWVPMTAESGDQGFDVYRSLLATGGVLFERPDFCVKARDFDIKSRWLLGDNAGDRFKVLAENLMTPPTKREFREGGYWLLGDKFGTEREVHILADAGPLGYLSIAAHGHADALAFTLAVSGQEILVDSGTYAYHTEKRWRDYFRGTSAHNTLTVDGVDQSVPGGSFLWLRKAQSRCLKFESTPNQDVWEAEHSGYQRLSDPVIHQRQLVLDKLRRVLSVNDSLECKERHVIALHWHFSEACDVQLHNGLAIVQCGKIRVRITLPAEGGRTDLVRGAENPPLGWLSRQLDKKLPIFCLRWTAEIQGPVRLTTDIKIEQEGDGA